ncbi:MAG: hypothetical protein OI74_11255 [Gammaproteobacteria bacterium (ex Lamellibrachia satsuma)]|nr:MAG: DUF4279 domain-containing protein [Gammaproteobacteria bacterium (ex Lamellibrachia satsuma)]RRS32492.1 MAG: hypothetical protein OI74_11255 [Gammaproteobacteria bacterium (ex Lamellibrachia satsuma)]RRS35442.1 MAG: hypothetical protein NV67_10460 [Gammaproteobacteria bacterium (ex Lamellibrachia satsuma)]
MKNKAEVYFALKGEDFDPDSFTVESGLKPTKSWQKGEKGRYVEHYRFGYWQIGEEAVEGETVLVDEIADKLIKRIEEKKEVIREFIDRHSLYAALVVVLHISMNEQTSTPALGFNTSTIQFLNFVKAEIDVDIYRN